MSMCVHLHLVAGARCPTRPFLPRAGGSHCVFVVCPAGSVHQHAATSFVILSVSLSSGCAACGRRGLCKRSLSSPTDVPCLYVCVCGWGDPPFLRPLLCHPSFCPLPADNNQISDTGASALAAALNGSQLNTLWLGEYLNESHLTGLN